MKKPNFRKEWDFENTCNRSSAIELLGLPSRAQAERAYPCENAHALTLTDAQNFLSRAARGRKSCKMRGAAPEGARRDPQPLTLLSWA